MRRIGRAIAAVGIKIVVAALLKEQAAMLQRRKMTLGRKSSVLVIVVLVIVRNKSTALPRAATDQQELQDCHCYCCVQEVVRVVVVR